MIDRQSITSYIGALGAVLSSLTLSDVGIGVGMALAVATWYSNRSHKLHLRKLADAQAARDAEQDARHAELHKAQLAAIAAGDRRLTDAPVTIDRRTHDLPVWEDE